MITLFILTLFVACGAIFFVISTVRAVKQRKMDQLDISFGTHPVGFVAACCVYVVLDVCLLTYSVYVAKDFLELYSAQ
jgi:hypothetical protein